MTHVWPRGDGSQRVREVFPAVGEGGEARWRSTDKAIALAQSRLGTIRHSDLLIGRVERLLLVGRRIHLLGGELGRRLRWMIFSHAPLSSAASVCSRRTFGPFSVTKQSPAGLAPFEPLSSLAASGTMSALS